ncbi:MAG: cytochrome b/b6 [Proteobacteria bacterium]|nr:cytochrome b/b6 [Pseudomonadota bacterium]
MEPFSRQTQHPGDQGAPKTNSVYEWIEYRLPVFSFINNSLGNNYPAPRNLNYWWNFGSIAGICLVLQILTGLFLAMHYTPHVSLAFDSVEGIMRNVNYGWLLRYAHAVGASMFFVVVYIHIARGLYYGSYKAPREILWWLGLVIFLLMMATAFMGYVLPWGQMSFWGATVITNLFSAIPLVGESIVTWLWGGFSVENPTLNRFFALHFLLPFVIVGVVVLHIWALHEHGSNNPLGINVKTPQDTVPFHPYYTYKDFFGFGVFFIIFAAFVFFSPNSLGHPDNYIPANPMITPAHIVPEWYFLPYYAILRATPDIGILLHTWLNSWFDLKVDVSDIVIIPSKLAGVLLMFGSILVMFALPWIDRCKVRSAAFRPTYRIMFWVFIVNMVFLGWLGAQPAEGKYIIMGRAALTLYFGHFIALWRISKNEKTLPLPESISKAVLEKAAHAHH